MIDSEDDHVYPVDASQCEDKLWLVKIPKFLFNEWLNAPDNAIVAKIVIGDQDKNEQDSKSSMAPSYKLICNPEYIKDNEVPTINKFIFQGVSDAADVKEDKAKNLSIGSRDGKTYALQSSDIETTVSGGMKTIIKKKALVGRVSVRCNVMPPNDRTYFSMKSKQIKTVNTPVRTIQIHEENVGREYKPKSTGTVNKKRDANRREGHRIRMDRTELVDKICSLFEQHQYYNIKDIHEIVHQPISFVKDVLKEVAQLSKQPSRRHLWELKPEYRHYQ